MSKGILSSVMASCLFAVMYFYTSLLSPLDGEEIFGWRTLLTLPCLTLFMLVSKDWKRVGELLARVKHTPLLLLGMVGTSWLMGVQLWLFLWAPLHGRSLEVSMGYFLLPLAMVLTGRLVYGERLSRLQKVAVACAALGVGHELYQHGSFAWETLVVTIGYPIYFVLRKRCRTDHLGGLWCDMCLLLPWALYFVIQGPLSPADLQAHPGLYALIPILGAISASALIAYVLASRLLPFSLFGLLSYVEPVLLVGVALLLGETIGPDQWLTYLPIWAAVLVLVIEGFKHLLRQRRRSV
ncbi:MULTISPECIES: EamA family transporter RarD [Pseudomonas]|uniref:EamA family transporter RarD n=1 Tax=Pseudomonas plecoglossicida TaxID=70775 RepID=A0ABX4U1S0_PSEDL|nr:MULTISPECIES: EamA family transporter RarD [Pseudomonas]UQB79584.1 EamA family transporter RarD [Pseudomonas shirazica]PLU85559.1 EamA family transporter RarD [Pseudomonas plecoglossicida]PLU91339.1 EamA family transporter RarD [Pseudomonas plecoglossicida]PLU99646.1 EamA family transporter RarD [Pseudomonas plecoglossicida]PLV12390.1 EamA family transporter RarD [Pseudomonas plecoglossicida]